MNTLQPEPSNAKEPLTIQPLRRSTRERLCVTIQQHFSTIITLAALQRPQRKKFHTVKQIARPVKTNCSAFAFTVYLLLMLSFCLPGSCEVILKPRTSQITAVHELSNTLGSVKLSKK